MSIDNETQCVIDNSIAEPEFMAIVPAVYKALLAPSYGNACTSFVLISGDSSGFMPNPVYNFNVSADACTGVMPDKKIRSGKINVRLTGRLNDEGSRMIVKLVDYMSGEVAYNCDSAVITTIAHSSLFSSFDLKIINGSCTTTKYKLNYRADRRFSVFPGANPSKIGQLTYFSGSSGGSSRQGLEYSTTVHESHPLVKYDSCRYVVKGMMELTPVGFKSRTIDFGEGTCDDQAYFTENENTVAFKLK